MANRIGIGAPMAIDIMATITALAVTALIIILVGIAITLAG